MDEYSKIKEFSEEYKEPVKLSTGDLIEEKDTFVSEVEKQRIPAFFDTYDTSWLEAKDAMKIMRCSRRTLQRKVKEGLIRTQRIRDNLNCYNPEDVYRLSGMHAVTQPKVVACIYARVKLQSEQTDLKEQIDRMTNFAAMNGVMVERIYSDTAPSMDFSKSKRPGFYELMLAVSKRSVTMIFIESPDRIARFGYELFLEQCRLFKVRVVFASHNPYKQKYKDEVVRELLDIAKYVKKIYDEPVSSVTT